MRVLVCGGRNYYKADVIGKALATYAPGTHTLVHGGCRGADETAANIAAARRWNVEMHPARWKTLGAGAGPIRNQEMVDSGADLLIAFPGGRGTADCVERAKKAGIPVREWPSSSLGVSR